MSNDLHHPSLLDAALAYAARGWPVFPLLPRDKRPLTPHGFKDATCDPAQIERWWRAHPDANLGLDCGGAGLVVIDVDVKTTDDALSAWAALDPGVPTLTAHSGGGGLHIFYRLPAGATIRSSTSRLAPGIDVRAAGGYIVLPPSIHSNGNRYRWAGERAVADLPRSLIEKLTADGRRPPDANATVDGGRKTDAEATADPYPSVCTTPQQPSVYPLSHPLTPSKAIQRPPSAIEPALPRFGALPKSLAKGPPTSYGLAALNAETAGVREAVRGTRNDNLNRAAYNLGQLVTDGHLSLPEVEASLTAAAEAAGLSADEIRKTLASGLNKGMESGRHSSGSPVVQPSDGPVVQSSGSRVVQSAGSQVVKSSDGQVVKSAGSQVFKSSDGQVIKSPNGHDHSTTRPSDHATTGPSDHATTGPSDHKTTRPRPRGPTWYAIEDNCLVSKRKTDHGLVTNPLANFQASITSMLISDDGAQKRRLYTLSGRTTAGRSLPEARIPADEFDSMRWVSSHWGAHAIITAGNGTRDHLSRAILTVSQQSMQERFIYTHLGWHALDNRRIFLCAADAGVTLEVERELEHYRVPPAPAAPEAARAAMRASLAFLDIAPPHVSIPLWAAMYLAPTNELVMPRFALWLYGVTGSLKSTLVALALNHFGDWVADDLAGWSSTANNLGKLLFLAKDVPFVIDDFAPQSDRRAADRQEATASAIIRDIGNHSGRGRMNADLTLAAVYRPRGLMLSTAEQLPDIGSILARLLTVEVRSGDVNPERLREQQDGRARYGEAMAGYLAWLNAHWDELKRRAPAEAKLYSAQLRESGRHLRVPEGLGLLHSGFVRALKYAEEIGALTEADADHWRAAGWRVVTRLAQKQSQIVLNERPVLRFVTILGELLVQGKLRLEPLRAEGDHPALRMIGAADAELIGWYDDSFIYLLPSATYNRVARFARDEGRHFATKEQALRRAMAEEGLIETEEGHNTMRLSINNRQQRYLRLHRAAVESMWGYLLHKSGLGGLGVETA